MDPNASAFPEMLVSEPSAAGLTKREYLAAIFTAAALQSLVPDECINRANTLDYACNYGIDTANALIDRLSS